MKLIFRKLTIILLLFAIFATSIAPARVQAATGITMDTYIARKNAFISDGRWRDYAAYGPRSPYISNWSSSGCCAYAADFCAYVYGSYYAWSSSCFTKFTSAAEIRTGDIINIPGHWFVVLERSGNSIQAAEGNVSGTWARITNNYWIQDGQLYDNWNKCIKPICAGYHYNFSYPVPGKPTLNVAATTQNKEVKFSWNTTANTYTYDIRLYKQGETTPFETIYGIKGNSYSYKLPAGNYYASLASVYNAYSATFGDSVSFTVKNETHKHSYKKQLVKATTKKNGYTVEKCSCGKTKNKKTIYFPKKITLSKTSYNYNGLTKTPKVTVMGSDNKVISSKNYTVTYASGRKKAGTYKVVVKFKGNYTGSVTKTFTITAKNHKHSYKKVLKKATVNKNGLTQYECSCGTVKNKKVIYYPETVKLSSTSYIYNGKVKKPKVTVVGSNNKVISSKNYTVTCASGRKKAGTYKVVIKFKGNYSGTVTKTFKIVNKWVYSTKLPSNVTSKKYEIQYKHTYKKTTVSYQNDGSVYESYKELPTSSTRELVGYYYYHFCGGGTGAYANFVANNSFVHYDSIAANKVTVASSGKDDDDASVNYYILNWKGTNNQVWCSSGTTCDGAYGSHGNRTKVWYRMNQYQNKKAVKKSKTTESGWTSKKDSTATKTVYRYRKK